MTRKYTAIVSFAALMALGAGLAHADSIRSRRGEWVTRQLGNKQTVQVYRPAPYALTGDLRRTMDESPKESGLQVRQLGNKLTTYLRIN